MNDSWFETYFFPNFSHKSNVGNAFDSWTISSKLILIQIMFFVIPLISAQQYETGVYIVYTVSFLP